MTIRLRLAAAVCVLAVLLPSGVAVAATSVGSGTTKCTVTAKAPTLTTTKQLTGSATVVCTATSLITVTVTVVELDGTVEDATVLMPVKTSLFTATKNVTYTIATSTVACISTEAGNEEYASKTRVSLSGLTSAYDRTAPANDSFAC